MPNEYNEIIANHRFEQMSFEFNWSMAYNDHFYGIPHPLWSESFRDFYAMYMMMSV